LQELILCERISGDDFEAARDRTPDRLVLSMNTGSVLAHSYDYPLVALSAMISILASYSALDLTERARTAKGWLRPVWLASGVIVMGLGIWAMHYAGMPDFAPGIRMRYDWPTMLLSLLAVSVASGLALYAAARAGSVHAGIALWTAAAGSISMAAGIAATNYFGVSAMLFPGHAVFSPRTILLSVALAAGLSFLALLLAFAPELAETPWAGRRLAGAVILGLAPLIAHYTWMAGTTFRSAPQFTPDLAHAVAISRFGLTTVALISLAVLAHVCTLARIDRRMTVNERQFLQGQLQLRTVFDNLAEGIAVLDLEGNILVANETTARVAGCSSAESMHGKLVEFTDAFTLAGAPIPSDERPIGLAMKGRYVRGYQARLRARGAPTSSFVEIGTAPIPGPDGKTAQIIVNYRDITERKRSEEARARLAAIVESSEDAIIGLDGRALVTSWNRGAEKLFGYPAEEMIGTSITRLIPEGREDEEDTILARIRDGEIVEHFETVRQRRDGKHIDVSLTISPIRDTAGVIVGASKIAHNITESKRQKDALDESRQRLESIIGSAMDAIIAADENKRVVLFNAAAERMFGCSQAEAVTGTIDRFIPGRFRAAHDGHIARFSQTGMTTRSMGELGSLWAQRASGEEFQIEASIAQLETNGHKLFTVILRDVTERIRAQQSLREQAQLLNASQVLARDMESRIVFWPDGTQKMYGYTAQEALGAVSHELFQTQFPEPVADIEQKLVETGRWEGELIHRRRDGSRIVVSSAWILHRDSEGRPARILESLVDVTGRRQAEENARQSEEKFAKAFRSSPIAMAITTIDGGRYVDVNQALLKMLGYAEHELVGRSVADLNIWTDPEQRAEVLAKIRQDGNVRSVEAPFRAKSGETRNVNISMETIVVDGVECLLTTAIDITETRNLELQFRQSQKMEAVGQLTGGIAHDFNNLLGVIVGNLDLLARQTAGDQVALKRVQAAQRASVRGAELTRRLLAFSRREQLNPAPVTVDAAIGELVDLAARTLGPEIRISIQCDANLPQIFVDAAALESALLNLAVNARDAMPRGGSLILSAHLTDLSSSHALAQTGELAAGQYVRIAVSDTGHGMPRETLERALEPFFTTKPRDKGTGLGLAMVYGFIKQSGGAIRLYSEPGFGTTVSLYLPLAGEQTVQPVQSAPIVAVEKLGGTALLVDDEADLLDVADAFLAELGYTVIRACDSASALAALERAGKIDLMVTDIIMPGKMNGIELAQKVRELRPGIKVIYTSGFPAEALAERSGKLEGGPLLHKPYQRAEFADMVRKSVNAGAA
jgi:PAS domain S-box-containing protein